MHSLISKLILVIIPADWLTNATQEEFTRAWTQKTCLTFPASRSPPRGAGSRWNRSSECVLRQWAVSRVSEKGPDGQTEAFISWSVWRKLSSHLDPPVQLAPVPAHNSSLWIRCQKPFPVINYFLCDLSGLCLSKSKPAHIAVCA